MVVEYTPREHMNTQRFNVTIPRDVAVRLKGKANKSAFITEALREKLGAEARGRLDEELAAAYRACARETRKGADDWDHLASDGL